MSYARAVSARKLRVFNKLRLKVVPGGGIEPPTRGFSVHCSTPELPGHGFCEAASLGSWSSNGGLGVCPEGFGEKISGGLGLFELTPDAPLRCRLDRRLEWRKRLSANVPSPRPRSV